MDKYILDIIVKIETCQIKFYLNFCSKNSMHSVLIRIRHIDKSSI